MLTTARNAVQICVRKRKMNELFNIPRHKNCTNCGECCGVIPASMPEINTIRNYIAVHGINPINHKDKNICPFRDNDAKKRLIYPVRPLLCRLFGVTKGMECKYGNSAEMDNRAMLKGREFAETAIINFVKW